MLPDGPANSSSLAGKGWGAGEQTTALVADEHVLLMLDRGYSPMKNLEQRCRGVTRIRGKGQRLVRHHMMSAWSFGSGTTFHGHPSAAVWLAEGRQVLKGSTTGDV
jgi:hypothetical protein